MLSTVVVYCMLFLLAPANSRQGQTAVIPQQVMATISGQVVDGDGKPVDHAPVIAYPVVKGTLARAQTDETGRFTLSVAKDGFYMVYLETEELDLDEEEDSHPFIQPGQGEVKLVMRRPNRMTFVVVDEATGAPIERYGLCIGSKDLSGGINAQEIDLRDCERGESVAHADPSRHVVRVQAPGYASVECEIKPEGETGARQTLRLGRGGSMFGRVATEGRPVSGASVVVARGPIGTVYWGTDRYEADSWFLQDYRKDLGDYVGRPRLVESASDGSFRFEDLSTGTYDLVVQSPGLGPALLKRIRVDSGQGRDVGILTLGAPATIRAKVIAGPGASPVGMKYCFDGDWWGRQEIANADGTFTIEGLGAGLHQLKLLQNASLPTEDAREVRLVQGETREIVFDLSGSAPCLVEVRVTRDGKPVKVDRVCARVTVELRAPGREPWKSAKVEPLLGTKDLGTCRGSVPGGHEAFFTVYGDNGLLLGQSPVETFPAGGKRVVQISLETGSLEFVFPERIQLPEYGYFEVSLTRGNGTQRFRAARSALNSNPRTWSSRRCDIGEIESGEYQVDLSASETGVDAEGNPDSIPVKTLIWGFRADVVVKPGETTVVTLP